jgi:hypothetical protein
MMSTKPRLSKSAIQLREQIDDAFPGRDRTSDGWIGDTRHAARKSDHNPDAQGWVRAIDIDRDLNGKGRKPDVMPDLVDQIRVAAKSGDKRISYIIFDGKIASAKKAWRWRPYDGINKHNHHAHISFTTKGDEDSTWFNIPMIGGN